MKMLKTLTALAFAMTLMFVGSIDASAKGDGSYDHSGVSCTECHTDAGIPTNGSVTAGFEADDACTVCHSAADANSDTSGGQDADNVADKPDSFNNNKDHTSMGDDGDGKYDIAAECGCHGPQKDETIHMTPTSMGDADDCSACHAGAPNLSTANVAPTGTADAESTLVDTAVTIDVLANDTDSTSDTLTITAFDAASTEGGVVEEVAGGLKYTPATGFTGNDTFTYTVSDGTFFVDVTVTVTVAANNAPVATADTATTIQGEAVVIDVAANDTDADGDSLTVALGTIDPAMGTIALKDGKITYTPAADFVGDATFTYTISDGIDTTTGNVTVEVLEDTDGDGIANDVDTDDDNDTILDGADQDSTVAATPKEDADNTAKAENGAAAKGTLPGFDPTKSTFVIETQPKNGTLSVNATTGEWIYTPKAGYEGTDTFTITYFNGTDVVEYTVTLTVTAEEEPPFGPDDNGGNDDDGNDDEEDPGSTNPNTGGTAGLMLAAAVTTASAAGLVVSRKRK